MVVGVFWVVGGRVVRGGGGAGGVLLVVGGERGVYVCMYGEGEEDVCCCIFRGLSYESGRCDFVS